MKTKQYKPSTAQEIFDDWKHYIGLEDIDGKVITTEALMDWAKRANRKLICVFCGDEPTDFYGFIYCTRCNEYKGIMPDVFNLNE